jgi:adenosylmethionine-8-amino-7-oxononanoate aminotransferase
MRSQVLRQVAQDNGVLLRPLGDTLYALPPACTTDEELDQIAHALHAMVKADG